MRNIRMIMSYDGTEYSGFQCQPARNTIQDKLEIAIFQFTGEKVKVISSGRTDAGVHARGQVINFLTSSLIPIERWCLGLNQRLPEDIVITKAQEVDLSFHARRAAKQKTYCYTINANRYPDVFQLRTECHHPTRLNVIEMSKALECIVGEHDFTSFCSIKSTKESHVRTIYDAQLHQDLTFTYQQEPRQAGILRLIITGNGFLYNMVRIIAGTLIHVGEGKKSSEDMITILEARDRSKAGPTAIAKGLMLIDVQYE